MKIKTLTPGFANLTSTLRTLHLGGQEELSDISELSALKNLQALDLSFTRVSDLEPLRGLQSLSEYLRLRGTEVTDLAPLENLTELQDLWMTDTKVDVAALKSLARLPNLRRIFFGYKPHALRFLRDALNNKEGVLGKMKLVNEDVLNEKDLQFYENREDLLLGYLPGFDVFWTVFSDIELRPNPSALENDIAAASRTHFGSNEDSARNWMSVIPGGAVQAFNKLIGL